MINRHLHQHHTSLTTMLSRMSQGRRITKAADDAAGSAMAVKLSARSRSRNAAIGNIERSLSILEAGAGGLGHIQDTLMRLREIAMTAADGTVSDADRAVLQVEVDELLDQIDDIAMTTKTNEKIKPLARYPADFVLGIDSSGSMGGEISNVQSSIGDFKQALTDKGVDLALGLVNVTNNVSNKGDSVDRTVKLADVGDASFDAELAALSSVGALVDPFNFILNALEDTVVGDQTYGGGEATTPDKINYRDGSARHLIYVTDTHTSEGLSPAERSALEAQALQALSDHNVTFHVIGNTGFQTEFDALVTSSGGLYLDIDKGGGAGSGAGVDEALDEIAKTINYEISSEELEVKVGVGTDPYDTLATKIPVGALVPTLGLADLKVRTQADAQRALDAIDGGRVQASGHQALFGAMINRLHGMVEAQHGMRTAEEAARSRIEDLDMAEAVGETARAQVRMRMATALVSQARELERGLALTLLGLG